MVKAISNGTSHSLMLTSGGFVYAWGLNGFGQLGDGTTRYSARPVKVKSLYSTTIASNAISDLLTVSNVNECKILK